nr:retrotransposable element Tf2 [Tanacetum cinerariifolium]
MVITDISNDLRNGKLVIGADADLRQELLKFYHKEPLVGHSGVEASYKRLKAVFYWKGMKKSVKEHTDGQTEVVNRCLECYLRCMTSEQPKEWVNWLSLAEVWYNTNYHTPINTTHFEIVYGQTPPTHVSYMAGDSHVEVVDRTLVARKSAISVLQFHLDRAQQRMKVFADKKRSDRSFMVGDWVLLMLQPHRQKSVVYWLVQWSNGNADDATWEVATELQAKYSEFDADSCGEE